MQYSPPVAALNTSGHNNALSYASSYRTLPRILTPTSSTLTGEQWPKVRTLNDMNEPHMFRYVPESLHMVFGAMHDT